MKTVNIVAIYFWRTGLRTLRVGPVAGGLAAGGLRSALPVMTWEAVRAAYASLGELPKKALDAASGWTHQVFCLNSPHLLF